MSFYSIEKIDSGNSCFSATVNLKFDWYDKNFIGLEAQDIPLENVRIPDLHIIGGIALEKMYEKVWIGNEKVGHIQYNVRYMGTFNENFEMQAFPFDTQALHLRVRSI